MVRLVRTYASDIGSKAGWPIEKFYDYVRQLPYRKDPVGNETTSRPAFLMQEDWPWRDCDDKAVLIGSWCYLNRIPFRFVASSTLDTQRLHHVFTVARIGQKNVVLDATYPHNKFGEAVKNITHTKDLTGEVSMQPMLNVYEGSPVMGWSMHRIKKGLRKAGRLSVASALPVPGARRMTAELMGDPDIAEAELMGSMFSKIKKISKNPLVKMAIKATPQGQAAMMALNAAKGKGKKGKGEITAMPEPKAGIPKVAIIGGAAAVAIVAFMMLKKKG